MPASSTSGGTTQSWQYDPEHSRYQYTTDGRTTWFLNPGVHQGGHYEYTQYASGTVEHRHTLYGGGRAVGEIVTFDGGAPGQTRYFHSDQLGSIVAVTDETGAVKTRFRYDPWGKQTLVSGSNTGIDQTRQGHTSHEMLDNGLTHMNGRLYDPVLARFVSADPTVDNPFDLQSLNRYSYVNNNPLGFTDPSGYFRLFGKKWRWWRDTVVKPAVAMYLGFGVFNFVGGYVGIMSGSEALGVVAGAAAGGTTMSLVTTGSTQGWQYNALSMALFYGVGDLSSSNALNLAENSIERAGLHAMAGCISAAASGGSCGRGAMSAGFSQYIGSNMGKYDGFVARVIIGGTASVLGGGKFENGAATAAFGYLFNCLSHPGACTKRDIPELLSDSRVKVFMSTLADRESGGDYYSIVGGGEFSDDSWHPNIYVSRLNSTAAGAYQMTYGTWLDASRAMSLSDFSPASQDIGAAYLLLKLKVMDAIIDNNMTQAVFRAARRWDAFPLNASGVSISGANRPLSPILNQIRGSN